ncbi:helix-turn-helix domain-containing protein [Roseomonas sp. NAR14]|uniref:Helix-turn-helix domain-containing protein n=1 Tax=Roseomonas acroporae TaxID=2937791 RepID=A0A9X1YD13_9PROT|nr:helix-turn-helix domain-containing protein [Roseomonas acroporae]MCK8788169.1 helix-turn-helix domain-containing protein [Roseomonas acroporae]
MADKPSRILTEQQFAERANSSVRTVQRWRVSGEGPPFVRLGPRKIGYREADIEAWVAARTYAHRAAEMVRTAA